MSNESDFCNENGKLFPTARCKMNLVFRPVAGSVALGTFASVRFQFSLQQNKAKVSDGLGLFAIGAFVLKFEFSVNFW